MKPLAIPTASLDEGFLAGHPIGTPDEVIATSTALAEAFGADEVMPALQALDTEPLQPASGRRTTAVRRRAHGTLDTPRNLS